MHAFEGPADVPSPIDFRSASDARQWAATAMAKRPWRSDIFALMSREIAAPDRGGLRLLELGSGPGFLAQRILQDHPAVSYTALDFSPAMHDLARERLGAAAARVHFVEADFKQPDWATFLPPFDAILTVQAVHEVRHRQHVPALYRQVRSLLAPGGILLMCDHFAGEGGMENADLYMTVEDQVDALTSSGFAEPAILWRQGGLVLYRCAAAR